MTPLSPHLTFLKFLKVLKKIIPASTPKQKEVIEKENLKGSRRRLGGLASLGPLGARLFKRSFEATFAYGYEKLAKKNRAQRRTN